MNVNLALEKLYSLHNFGIKLGLERVSDLLEHIGNPHQSIKAFHIAGTNGKGSVTSFIASMLIEAGYKTGQYVSPHYVRFNERIKVNGEQIPDEYIADFVEKLSDYIDEHKPTFFELTTAMMFKYFAENNIDYAAIETGLGGRLDATNLLDPVASIISTIGVEHESILGDSLEKIAYEKGGIIKEGKPVFTGSSDINVLKVLSDIASFKNTDLFKLDNYVIHNKGNIKLFPSEKRMNIYSVPIRGEYQFRNAALAALALIKTIKGFSLEAVLRGIGNVKKNSGMEGRYEVYKEKPRVIFDSAHNPHAIESFLSSWQNEQNKKESCFLLFGAMRDKNIPIMLKMLAPFFGKIYITAMKYERGASVKELEQTALSLGLTAEPVENAARFVTDFSRDNSDSCLVVLGSIYLLGEIKEQLCS